MPGVAERDEIERRRSGGLELERDRRERFAIERDAVVVLGACGELAEHHLVLVPRTFLAGFFRQECADLGTEGGGLLVVACVFDAAGPGVARGPADCGSGAADVLYAGEADEGCGGRDSGERCADRGHGDRPDEIPTGEALRH